MKNRCKTLLSLLSLPLLAGCVAPTSQSESKDSEVDEGSSLTPSSSLVYEESSEEESWIDVDYDPAEDDVDDDFSYMMSGWMTDISVGRPLATGCSYPIDYGFKNHTTVGSYATVTDNGVLEVDDRGVSGNFTLVAKKPGRSVLCIYDDEDYLHYRGIVEVKKKKTLEEIREYLYLDVDHYETQFFKGSRLTFFDERSGQYSGKDENIPLQAPIPFVYESDASNPDDGYNYWFIFTTWDNQASGGSLTCVRFSVDYTGYMINLFTSNTILDWLIEVVY